MIFWRRRAILPEPPAPGDDPVDSSGPFRLHQPDDSRRAANCVLVIFFTGLGCLFALVIAVAAISSWQQPGDLLATAIFGGLVLLLLALSVLLLAQLRRERIIYIQVDGTGLNWWQGRQVRHADWHELQGFNVVYYLVRYSNKSHHIVFALDASSAVVAWELTNVSTDAEHLAHQYLCNQILEHASLRLRDLTETIEKLQQEDAAARATTQRTPAKTPEASLLNVSGMLPEPVNPHIPAPRAPRKLSLGTIGSLLLLLPAVLLFLQGWGAQHYESYYYATLVQRVHEEQPLYQDSLATPDGQWCLQQPTPKNSEYYTYVNSSYQMGGGKSSDFMDCWTTSTYSDYAVEATARQIGSAPPYAGVGLGLRVSQDRMEVFTVDQYGYWSLLGYDRLNPTADPNWTPVYTGYSSAIHRGTGATNRLLIVAHGNEFIFYVNNVYMTNVALDNTLTSGYIAAFSDDAAVTASFTNFATYPLPSLALPLPWGS